MEDRELRFCLDEQLPVAIAEQLIRRDIDTVTVQDLRLKGRSGAQQLRLANDMGRVLCTLDDDYFDLVKNGAAHSGIVFGSRKDRRALGTWVRFLIWMHETYTPGEMRNHIEYLRIVLKRQLINSDKIARIWHATANPD